MARIAVRQPGEEESVRELAAERVRVGRGRGCDVVLSDGTASREHCELVRTPHGYTVADLGGRNPAQLNGRPLTAPTLLTTGDVVRVGKTDILYVCAPGEFSPAPPPAPVAPGNAGSAGAAGGDTTGVYPAEAEEEDFDGLNSESGRRVFEQGYRPLTEEELAPAPANDAEGPAPLGSEAGRRSFEQGYRPLTEGEVATPPEAPRAAPGPRPARPGAGFAGGGRAPTRAAPALSPEDLASQARRRRNDKLAKLIMFLLFMGLPFAAVVYFVVTRMLD